AEKIEKAEVSISTLARVEQLSREEKKNTGEPLTQAQKEEWVERLSGLSRREADLEIRSVMPLSSVRESEKILTQNSSALTVILDHETIAQLERLQELWSGSNPGISRGEVISRALELAV